MLRYVENNICFIGFNIGKRLCVGGWHGHEFEITGSGNLPGELAAVGAMVVVYHCNVYILHFVIGRQWHDHQLNDGHDEDHPQDGRVAEDLAEFFFDEEAEHGEELISLRVHVFTGLFVVCCLSFMVFCIPTFLFVVPYFLFDISFLIPTES